MTPPRKKHERVYEEIRAQITSGELSLGVRLPNERTLAANHGVAVMTLRKAMDRLKDEGFLTRRPHHGTIVTSAKGVTKTTSEHTNLRVGLVIPLTLTATAHPVFSRLINGIEGALSEHRVEIKLVVSNPSQTATEKHFLNVIKNDRVDGWIIPSLISPEIRSALKRSEAPKVLMHLSDDDLSPHFFETDYAALGCKIGNHLLEQGYRQIMMFSHALHTFIHEKLFITLEETLHQQGGTLQLHLLSGRNMADGVQACRNLLQNGRHFDAAFCYDDDMAFGVIQALKEFGLTPPDVGVIGSGDFPLGAVMTPTLTTISFPYYQKGREMAALLMDLIRKRPVEPAHRTFSPRLIVRASSQNPHAFASTAHHNEKAITQ